MVTDVQFQLALSRFLREDSTVRAMVAASESGRPAVEAIGAGLLAQFGGRVRPTGVRKQIGRLVRPIMESQGFEPHRRRQPAKGVLFTAGTVYRPESLSVFPVLDRHNIDLPEHVIQRELHRATEGAIGNPPFVSWHRRVDWDVLVSGSPPREKPERLRAFVTALDHELQQQAYRRDTAMPSKQLRTEDRRHLGLDELSQRQPCRHLTRVRTAFKVGALYATGITVRETARLLDVDGGTVMDWVDRRCLYKAPIGQAQPPRLPLFQFDVDGLVPKVQEVLPRLSASMHPVGVFNWFTGPNPDLALKETDFEPTSPRDWLRRGYATGPVCRLAAAVPLGIAA